MPGKPGFCRYVLLAGPETTWGQHVSGGTPVPLHGDGFTVGQVLETYGVNSLIGGHNAVEVPAGILATGRMACLLAAGSGAALLKMASQRDSDGKLRSWSLNLMSRGGGRAIRGAISRRLRFQADFRSGLVTAEHEILARDDQVYGTYTTPSYDLHTVASAKDLTVTLDGVAIPLLESLDVTVADSAIEGPRGSNLLMVDAMSGRQSAHVSFVAWAQGDSQWLNALRNWSGTHSLRVVIRYPNGGGASTTLDVGPLRATESPEHGAPSRAIRHAVSLVGSAADDGSDLFRVSE